MAAIGSYGVVAIVLIGLHYLLVIPLIGYFTYFFAHKIKNKSNNNSETFFSRRHPSTIYTVLGLTLFSIGIERPLVLLFIVLRVLGDIHEYQEPLTYFLIAFSSMGIVYVFWLRSWTIFYTYKYYIAEKKITWKEQLNPDYDTFDNFFFKNKKTWGSFVWVAPFIFVLWMLSVILLPIFAMTSVSFELGNLLILILPFLFLLFIAYKISPVNDMYYVRDELLLCISVLGLTLVVYLVFFITMVIVKAVAAAHTADDTQAHTQTQTQTQRGQRIADEAEHDDIALQIIVSSIISTTSYSILCYVITVWVVRKFEHSQQLLLGSYHNSSGHHGHGGSTRRGSETLSTKQNRARAQKLGHLLQSKRGYHLFMDHLVKEVSIENLLFVTEYIQYKKHISRTKLGGRAIGWMADICLDAVPKSEVITKYENNILAQIHLLYEKYIQPGTDLEVNIAGKTRKKYKKAFNEDKKKGSTHAQKVNENEGDREREQEEQARKVDEDLIAIGFEGLSCFFDDAVEEIWRLMNDSFLRCKETQIYQTWWEALPKIDEEDEENASADIVR